MKKIRIAVALCFVTCCSLILAACGGSDSNSTSTVKPDTERIYDELVAVYKLTYKIASTTRELYSNYSIAYGPDATPVGEEEYDSLPLLHDAYKLQFNKDMSTPIDNWTVGDYVAWGDCYKKVIVSITFDKLFVRILNSQTIIIRTNDGMQTVSTEFFNIEYFM